MRVRALGALFVLVCAAALAGATAERSRAVVGGTADALDVLQIGNATSGGSSAATPVYVVPVLGLGTGQGTTGTPIPLPTAQNGTNAPLTMSGSASSEGALQLSADGRYLTVAGYAAVP